MDSVKEHYERLLARHYTWMFGKSFEERVTEQKAILKEALETLRVTEMSGPAVDLGSGPGYQSVALAKLGFSPVLAIDTSTALLDELRKHASDFLIQIIEDDMLHLDRHVPTQSAHVIVCMGDTITHLEDRAAVLNLLRAASSALVTGGALIITYRDLSIELHGIDRFLPVHSDHNRVMTCFLEFDQDESVMVHDLVYTRESSGWRFEKSSYKKLRLPVQWLENAMTSVGLEVSRSMAGRLARLVGRKL